MVRFLSVVQQSGPQPSVLSCPGSNCSWNPVSSEIVPQSILDYRKYRFVDILFCPSSVFILQSTSIVRENGHGSYRRLSDVFVGLCQDRDHSANRGCGRSQWVTFEKRCLFSSHGSFLKIRRRLG